MITQQETAVTIIMPAYNKADVIGSSLAPLLEQQGLTAPYEVIVVDNNSTDDTGAVVRQLAQQYPHLRYVSETRQGAGAARNRGIVEAKGNLIIFIDDDIKVQPDHVARHLAYHQANPSHLCVVGYVDDHTTAGSAALKQYIHTRATISARGTPVKNLGISLVSQNFSVRIDTLELIAFEQDNRRQYFDENFYKRQDGELGYRLEKAGVKFIYTTDIRCEHQQVYTWKNLKHRAYWSGYHLQRLFAKHPELKAQTPHLVIRNPVLNTLLLGVGLAAFAAGYVIQRISPILMLKGISAWVLYHSSRGYQQAAQDYR